MKTYHESKCQSCIRKQIVLNDGLLPVKIIMTGKHAFKYSVILIKLDKRECLTFANRIQAIREFNRLLSQYKSLGDVKL